MVFDIIVGRNEEDKKKLGKQGVVFLGKQYVQIGSNISLANNIYLDVAKTHHILIVGKKGSGKSFSASVIAEEISTLPEEIKKNISVLFFDTMGVFWTMKFPNKRQQELLEKWGMKPESIPIEIYVPEGYYNFYKENKIPVDFKFSLRVSELNASDWCDVFDVKITDSIGVALESTLLNLKENKTDFSIENIITEIKESKKISQEVKNALENRFFAADKWGLFNEKGTKIKDLVGHGKVSVLDISAYTNVTGNTRIKALVISIISRRILEERILSRKKEEIEEIEFQSEYFKEDKEQEEPLVWLVLDECLPYKSVIKTNKGDIKIGDLVNRIDSGEEINVRGYDKKKDSYGYYKIKKTFKIKPRELIKLKTETGRELECTPDHPVLTKRGYVYASSADNLAFPLEVEYKLDPKLILARVAGHIIGDGYLATNEIVGFSGKGNKDLELIREDLKLIGIKTGSKIYERITNSEITNYKGESVKVIGISQELKASRKAFRYFKSLGLPVGEKVTIPYKIPRFIIEGSLEEKREFIAALFASDGFGPSKANNSKLDFNAIRFSFNKIEELESDGWEYAKELILLLKEIGVETASVKKTKGNIRKDKKKTIKFLITLKKSVSNTIKFLEKIGFKYNSKKEINSKKWLAYLKYYETEIDKWDKIKEKAVYMYMNEHKTKAEIGRLLQIKPYRVTWWVTHNNQRVRVGKELIEFNDWMNARCKGKVLYEKIKSIEILNPEPLFDIEVDEVHNFIANETIVHNCHEFLPKDEKTPATDTLARVIREGRQPGISLILITQQPGELIKDALTQADIVIAHRLTAKRDIEALNSIMQSYLVSDLATQINNLPKYKGAAILLDDNSERIYQIQVHPKKSWHGGEAPTSVKETKQEKLLIE